MTDQVHIRDAETAWLLRTLAKQSGMTMKDVLKEALKEYRPKKRAVDPAGGSPDDIEFAYWKTLIERDRAKLKHPTTPMDDLHDPESGLPI